MESVRVDFTRMGSTEELLLSDSNDVWWSTPYDGVYVGEVVAPHEAYLSVRLYVKTSGGEESLLFDGNVPTPEADRADVTWWVQDNPVKSSLTVLSPPFTVPAPVSRSATVVPLPYSPAMLPFRTSVKWMIATWWMMILFGYAGYVASRGK